jgi:predicted dinucleotide-binding enzyme
MKIGIIGTGNMGRVLGGLWAEMGHNVFFGSRNPVNAEAARKLCDTNGVGHRAQAGSNDEAAVFGELIYFNPRDVAASDVLVDVSVLDGKVIIDSHNGPLPEPYLSPPVNRSRSELLQAELPRSKVVKAFNTMAQEVFELCPEQIRPERVSVFIASDFQDAKTQVMSLVHEMGMVPVDCGPLRGARQLESLGDFIRSVIGSTRDVMSTISVHSLPEPTLRRLGGRSPTRLP